MRTPIWFCSSVSRRRSVASPRAAWLFTVPRAEPERLGDLGLGQALVVAQHQHRALLCRQLTQVMPHVIARQARADLVGGRRGSRDRVNRTLAKAPAGATTMWP